MLNRLTLPAIFYTEPYGMRVLQKPFKGFSISEGLPVRILPSCRGSHCNESTPAGAFKATSLSQQERVFDAGTDAHG